MKKYPGFMALITVIAVGAVGLIIAVVLLLSGIGTSKTSLSVFQSTQAQGAANACAELALGAIQANIAINTPASATFTLDSGLNINCSYTITGSSPNYSISSVGTAGASSNVTRRVNITLNRVGPTLNIAQWQEF
jgi:hypothetical protein